MATSRPTAVATSASEIPADTDARPPEPEEATLEPARLAPGYGMVSTALARALVAGKSWALDPEAGQGRTGQDGHLASQRGQAGSLGDHDVAMNVDHAARLEQIPKEDSKF